MAAYKVNSAYAKFSSSGGLSCTLCNCSVKSAKVWIAHERGRAHIEKLRALKAQSSREAAQASSVEKRKAEVDEANSDPKRARLSDNESDGSSEFSAEEAAGLPEDFFDQSMETSAAPEIVGNVQENVENSASQLQGVASEAPGAGIPEGFFDDPLEDAKKRGAELKDPLDEEWSRFQREIVMEENLAEEMLEGDLEQMNLERSLEELDEEITQFTRRSQVQIHRFDNPTLAGV